MERPDNTVFKYFYCQDFKWLHPLDNELRDGHPRVESVYRGWYNTETRGYKVLTNSDKAIHLEQLKLTSDTDNFLYGFTCDFREITKTNILEFKLTEQSLTDMLQWLQIDNADLKERLGFTSPPPNQLPPPNIVHEIQTSANREHQEYMNSMQGFLESGEELHNISPIAFEKIWQLIDHILDETYKIPEGPLDSEYLRYDIKGMSTNINDAYKSINKYAGNNRKTNENPEDLYEAIGYLLIELMRREYNNLDQ